MNKTLVELHVEDFEPIKKYYLDMGFEIVWERPAEESKGYMVLQLQGNIICFWPGTKNVYAQSYFKKYSNDTPRGNGVELVIMIDDIDAYYKQHEEHANVIEPLKLQPWGLKDFRVADPAGYYLRFTVPHDILDPKFAIE